MAKTNGIISYEIEGSVLTFAVRGAEAFDIDAQVVCDASPDGHVVMAWAVMSDTARACFINGLKQKIADRAAIPHDPDTGLAATPQEKFEAMFETAERLANGGPWNVGREGGKLATGGILSSAMMRLWPVAFPKRSDVAAHIKAKAAEANVKPADVKRSLESTPKIAAMIAQIRAEMPVTVDVSGMLEELEVGQSA